MATGTMATNQLDIAKLMTENISTIKNIEKTFTDNIITKLKTEQTKYNAMNKELKEGFEGIRKDNSRMIFGILLSFIIIDFLYSIITE